MDNAILKDILTELKGIKVIQDKMEKTQQKMEKRQDRMEKNQLTMAKDIADIKLHIEKGIYEDLERLKNRVKILEEKAVS